MHIDPTPTWPSQAAREKFMAEMLEKIHTTGPFEVTELDNNQKSDLKQLFKEAANEWLEDKFATFGRWAFISVLAMVFIGLIFFAMTMQGWHLSKSVAEAAESAR